MSNDTRRQTADDAPALTRAEIADDLERTGRQLARLAADAALLSDAIAEASASLRVSKR